MARPFKSRRVCELPSTSEFSPCNKTSIERVELGIDEYEVVRLIDNLGLTQNECAQQMNVARTTVQSIYDSARKKIADALVNGKRLIIQGGNYHICPNAKKCCGKNCQKRKCGISPCEFGVDHCQGCHFDE
ncbi:MAG: DUF134 domain-containing protein [Lachnospiraceae bacterium]|nr:DUF134 domain-containing protein [Lachnospiraceae bacterium]